MLVTDGFTGNIFLKTVEGAASLFSHALKDMLLGSTKNKLAALLLKNSIGAFKKRFDANEVGGTALLGISQPVIKAHGSSNAYAFFNAIRQAQVVAQADIVGDIAANVATCAWNPGRKRGNFSNLLLTEPEIVPILSTASPVKWIPKRSSSI